MKADELKSVSLMLQLTPAPGIERKGGISMSGLLWISTHAPAEPQDWFNPVMDRPCPAVPSIAAVQDEALRDELRRTRDDLLDISDASAEAQAWWAARHEAGEAQAQWQADFRRERLLQWPTAWALHMVEAGSRYMEAVEAGKAPL